MADEEPVTAPTPRTHAGPDPQPGRTRRQKPNHSRPGITPANSPDPIPAIMRGPVAPLYLNPPPVRHDSEDPGHRTAGHLHTPGAPPADSGPMNETADKTTNRLRRGSADGNARRQDGRLTDPASGAGPRRARQIINAARQPGRNTDEPRPVINGPRPVAVAVNGAAGPDDPGGALTGVKQAGLSADGRPRARVTVNRRQRLAAAGKPQVTPPSRPPVEDWDTAAALRNDPTTELPIIQDRRRSGRGEVTVDLSAKYGLKPGDKTARRTLPDPDRSERVTSSPDPTARRKPAAPPSWPRPAPTPDEPVATRLDAPAAAVRQSRSSGPTGGRVAPKPVRRKHVDRIPAPMQFRPIVCVTDMPANITFFERLGAEVVHGQPRSDYVLMQLGTVQLGLVREPVSSAQTAVELNFATPYPLADFERRLRAQDVVIAVTVHDTDLGSQLHVQSPDGLVIRITQLEPVSTGIAEIRRQRQSA